MSPSEIIFFHYLFFRVWVKNIPKVINEVGLRSSKLVTPTKIAYFNHATIYLEL